jgi:cephalosporin hydroxylase
VAGKLPPPVATSLGETVRDYWVQRVDQHVHDSYAGLTMSKFPEDLRVYEHLIWESKPNVVIEIGAQHGGSTLWFRDRLVALAAYVSLPAPRVISIDADIGAARRNISSIDPDFEETISLIEADVRDPGLSGEVEALLPSSSSCLVVEDTAHEYETTIAALRGFSSFVGPDGFFVVEDGCVDVEDMRLSPDWPRGVLPALHEWLRTEEGSRFTVRRDLELYGVSCHPEGFLQRVT